jgi:hypothetical protein
MLTALSAECADLEVDAFAEAGRPIDQARVWRGPAA